MTACRMRAAPTCAWLALTHIHRPVSRPNFIFILADDLGYADLGCYGERSACSPVLDRTATEGMRFTNGYANSSVCSPSRFAIITGRYQHRLRGGFDERIAREAPHLGLPPEHPTSGCGCASRSVMSPTTSPAREESWYCAISATLMTPTGWPPSSIT